MDEHERIRTDYLIQTLQDEEQARLDIFLQMIAQLELNGLCRTVYHRLGIVLFGSHFPLEE